VLTPLLQAKSLPNIKILATGGTIAGAGNSPTDTNYTSGQIKLEQLTGQIYEIEDIANISAEQIAAIGSQNLNNTLLLQLAQRINTLLASKKVDGVVITHGTDTLEETAYFLKLTVKSNKPVVLTGAMRPATAISADGPLNLLNAIVVASAETSKNRGVLVAINGAVMDARDVTKMNTTNVQTFQSPNFGNLGFIHNKKVFYYHQSECQSGVFNVDKLNALPDVGIVYGYANASPLPVEAFINNKFDGIIHAGVGNGNICNEVLEALQHARAANLQVVRSSRVPVGATTADAEVDDEKYGFIASGTLNPQKARILLMLALTQTRDWKEIQQYFLKF